MQVKENVSASPAKSVSTPKSKAVKITSKGSSKSSHPPTSEMVNTAIKELKDRKGSSLQAIKKYISSTYKVDGEKLAPFIRRYLKSAVTSGAVVQTKGKGASGSFKLPVLKDAESRTKVQRAVKATEPKTPKKSVEKKTTARKPAIAKSPAKKTETAKKTVAAKKPAAKKSPVKTEKPAKSRKTAKAPAAKTRTPKPKRASASRTVKPAAKK
ncbi:histone H1 [Lasioglossum baleicum]|uniref:histone H1 n=1 Tax=Lasioglossum baleicum TaxID=434251 RepID=UPI003FCE8ED8